MVSISTDRRQGVNAGAAVKVPVKTATTANITLSGLQTIDGVALADGDRVLVKNQTDGTENGIYEADSGDWTRTPDFDGVFDVVKGTFVYVTNGSTTVGFWYVTTSDPITPGTTSLSISMASSVLAQVSAFVQTLLPSASAAAFLTTLGFSAFFQTLIDDADANAVLTSLGIAVSSSTETSAVEFSYQQHGAI